MNSEERVGNKVFKCFTQENTLIICCARPGCAFSRVATYCIHPTTGNIKVDHYGNWKFTRDQLIYMLDKTKELL